ALEAQLAARTGAVKVKWLIAELEQMTEIDRTHLREVASDEIKAILSAFAATPAPMATECKTEGCAHPASVRLQPCGVGSDYCHSCYMRIQALTATQEAGKP